MSKSNKSATPEVPKSILDTTGRKAIAREMVSTIEAVGSTGSLLTHMCETANKFGKGKPLGSDDIDYIIAEVVKSPSMQAKRKVNVRTFDNVVSKYRTVLAVYASIPEASEALRQRVQSVTHHHVFSLAGKLRKGATVKDAVADVAKSVRNAGTEAAGPANVKEAKGVIASAFKRVLKLDHLPQGFAKDLRKLAVDYDIALGNA